MREILRAARDRDADVVAWLEVIEQFDHAVAAQASVEELVRLAGDITGMTVGVRDDWSRVRVEVTAGILTSADSKWADVAWPPADNGARHRSAVAVDTPRGPALAAPIEVASGRAGVAWVLGPASASWEPGHHLVVERLARAVAARTLEARKQRSGSFDPAAVERLLCVELSDDELAQASRQATLSASDRYVAVALAQTPADAVTPETLAAVVQQAIADRNVAARSAVVGRRAAVVARASSRLEAALQDLARSEDRLGFVAHMGVGDAHDLAGLRISWSHAQEALALRDLLGAKRAPVYFDRLGVLHLLAQIPAEHVVASPLLGQLTAAAEGAARPSELEVLAAYLEEGTLRRAGDRVFLHHTTVQHRLKSLERRLGVDLRDPATRFQLQLAVKLLAIVRANAAAPGT